MSAQRPKIVESGAIGHATFICRRKVLGLNLFFQMLATGLTLDKFEVQLFEVLPIGIPLGKVRRDLGNPLTVGAVQR